MTVIVGLLQFVGATVILIYGVEESSTLTNELHEYLLKLVYDWDNDPKAAAVLKQIMEYVSIEEHEIYFKKRSEFLFIIWPQPAWTVKHISLGITYV